MIIAQLEEELCRASYILNEGDTAAFIPNKFTGTKPNWTEPYVPITCDF